MVCVVELGEIVIAMRFGHPKSQKEHRARHRLSGMDIVVTDPINGAELVENVPLLCRNANNHAKLHLDVLHMPLTALMDYATCIVAAHIPMLMDLNVYNAMRYQEEKKSGRKTVSCGDKLGDVVLTGDANLEMTKTVQLK